MGRLIYSGITSLDGYVADADGSFDWSVPDEEVHSIVNELERPIGTYLYGRRLSGVMLAGRRGRLGSRPLCATTPRSGAPRTRWSIPASRTSPLRSAGSESLRR